MKKLVFITVFILAAVAFVPTGGMAQERTTNGLAWTAPATNDLVFVAGAVKNPGEYTWTNGMTFKDAVTVAGGFTEFQPTRLKIRHRDGTEESFKIKKADPFKKNPKLKSGDYVGCLREVD